MKKIGLLSLLTLGLGFAACDNYEEPNPPAQYNPQESVLKTDDVVVTDLLNGAAYELVTLNDNDENINVANIQCESLPASYDFGAIAYISADDFNSSTEVTASVVPAAEANNWTVTVSPDDMQAAFYSGISKGPKAKDLKIRFLLTTVTGSQTAYVGGPEYFYGDYALTVTPFPSELVIEEAYYLVGTIDDWSVAGAIKLNHSDLNQYDDPVFSIKINVPANVAADGWWWKIIPQSTYELGDWSSEDYSQYGVAENGDTAAEGMLVPKLNGEDPGAGMFTGAGDYLLTINMEEGTYAFTSAFDFLYTPGNSNGWSQTASQLLATNDYVNYFGYAYLNGEFKFSSAPNWDGTNYGAAGDGELSTDGGAGNLNSNGDGLFWCDVNIANLTYSLTPVTTIGVIGDSTPNGWDASTALTPSEDYLVWTGDVTFKNGNFKFRANDDWAINLGGTTYTDLVQDGDNLPSPGEGTYTVTLYLNQLPYSCSLVKK